MRSYQMIVDAAVGFAAVVAYVVNAVAAIVAAEAAAVVLANAQNH